jgi:hypothetical protein
LLNSITCLDRVTILTSEPLSKRIDDLSASKSQSSHIKISGE